MSSVRTRFLFTVGVNLTRSLLSFVTGMLVARWLAPEAYGEMAFLLGTFVALRQLLDMGSSSAFFTFMSQRPRPRRFVNGYLLWLAGQFVFSAIAIGLLLPSETVKALWHGEPRGLVVLAYLAAFMQNSLWPMFQQAGESQRQTIRVQAVAVVVVLVHLAAVSLLWLLGKLALPTIFAAIAIEYFVGAMVVRRLLNFATASPEEAPADSVPRQYWRYCLPLIPYAWVSFAYEFADRWLLQSYGGNVQQAYYAVSSQFAAVALIATTSILTIFWKEVAEAHHRGDRERTAALYRKVSRVLFFVGAAMAGFLCPWADDLLQLVLGAAYVGGATTLAIMFIYPVHQSMGQIGSTMLYATERVGVQVGVGIVFMLVSIGVTYFVLAPADAPIPGLGLAATGLAIKMVAVQLVQANVIAYILSRLWNWRFDWVYQPVGLLGCLALGWLAFRGVTEVFNGALPVAVGMLTGGLVYLLMLAAFVYAMPWVAGFNRRELIADAELLLRKVTG